MSTSSKDSPLPQDPSSEVAVAGPNGPAFVVPKAFATVDGNGAVRRRREEKLKKKDPKAWNNVKKTIENLDKTEALSVVEAKYSELYDELRQAHLNYQQLENYSFALKRDANHNQVELTKTVMVNVRLENLCRELQKVAKEAKDEGLIRLKEEEDKRKEVTAKFSEKLSDISCMMEDNKVKSDELRNENLRMTEKLSELYVKFQERVSEIARITKQMELERELHNVTKEKLQYQLATEKEMYETELRSLRESLEKSEQNCKTMFETIKSLNEHIDVYKLQYEEFEKTMSKSNNVFDGLKSQMSFMKKQITSLEKEVVAWKMKYHEGVKTIISMTEQHGTAETLIAQKNKNIKQLEKLCRQLQIDRSNYYKLLKLHGIDGDAAVPSADKDPMSAQLEDVQPADKVESESTKETELKILKENLKLLTLKMNSYKSSEESDVIKPQNLNLIQCGPQEDIQVIVNETSINEDFKSQDKVQTLQTNLERFELNGSKKSSKLVEQDRSVEDTKEREKIEVDKHSLQKYQPSEKDVSPNPMITASTCTMPRRIFCDIVEDCSISNDSCFSSLPKSPQVAGNVEKNSTTPLLQATSIEAIAEAKNAQGAQEIISSIEIPTEKPPTPLELQTNPQNQGEQDI